MGARLMLAAILLLAYLVNAVAVSAINGRNHQTLGERVLMGVSGAVGGFVVGYIVYLIL